MPDFQLKATQQQSHVLTVEQGTLLNFVQEQSLSDVQELLENMEQQGELEFDLLPVAEEDEQLDDADDFDAEWCLDDEDAPALDESSPTTENSEKEPFPQTGEFEIRVVADKTGKVRCIAPENAWSTARPLNGNVKAILDAYDRRINSFAIIARWMERAEGDLLAKGVDAFLKYHRRKQQKDFVKESQNIDTGAFSRHIKNAYISWSNASIPMHLLFL